MLIVGRVGTPVICSLWDTKDAFDERDGLRETETALLSYPGPT